MRAQPSRFNSSSVFPPGGQASKLSGLPSDPYLLKYTGLLWRRNKQHTYTVYGSGSVFLTPDYVSPL